MKQAVTCAGMKALDAGTINKMDVPSCVLMERAALKTAEELDRILSARKEQEKILCVCGSGNNGGDGVAVGRILKLWGYDAEIFMAGNPDHMTEETRRQKKIADNYQVREVNNPDWDEYTTIVDALFGVGLARPVKGRYAELIRQMNGTNAFKAAVDIPSGVDGDTGQELGAAFRADLTVTFAYRKAGLCLYPGRMLAGRVVTADIGIYADPEGEISPEKIFYPEQEDLNILPPRIASGNKGTFGKVLAAAGSEGMCGAAYFAAGAALTAGAGMVRILTPEGNRIPLQTLFPEAILTCISDKDTDAEKTEKFQNAYRWSDVLILGPGLGISTESTEKALWFLKAASADRKPLILDADGLNLLAAHPEWKKYLGAHVILTPHMGEMSRMTGKTISELQADRIGASRELAADTGCTCVLKDACTVTAAPDGTVFLNLSGNPGMATAGSGDALSGILAGTVCRFLSVSKKEKDRPDFSFQAALGVYLHGLAGDLAAKETGVPGMRAGDIIRSIPGILKNVYTEENKIL